MQRLVISPPQPLPDGAHTVRFLAARTDGDALELLFSLETPPYGLYTYRLANPQRDSIGGRAAFGGGELEEILQALTGVAGQGEGVIHLLESRELAGKTCRIVAQFGKPMVWVSHPET